MTPARSLRWAAIVAPMLIALSVLPASAADLGVRGATWPVAEPDLLAEIESRLAEMHRSGELARFEAEARARARSRLEEPEPVPGLAPAREHRTRLFDPAIVVDRDIRLPDGTLIAAAGTRVDPFHHMPLTRDLLFVDGRRGVEVAWALAHEAPAKIVLLAGRPLDLARAHARPFYFDQGGRLAVRLGLRFTPALVERDGSRLRITEIPIESLPPRLGGRDRLPGSGDRDASIPQRED